tara:strand:- start:888 stop:1964 length:1077 start_codon:yes stop_codon:yes gene_type:complete
MKISRIALVIMVVALSGTVVLESLQRQRDVDVMTEVAADFLASLSSEQREQATFGFESEERSRHHFIPPEAFERHGLVYSAMTSEQKVRALDLLRSGLSQQGYLTAQQIMEVEGILGVLVEGEGRRFPRDQDAYWVSVFGTPATGATWGWRWEGHHLSLHFTLVDGAMTVSTPTFLGANPATVPSGPRQGLRAMKTQEDTARELLASLDAEQREVAIFDDVAPTNVVTGADLVVDPLDPIGVPGAELSPSQRELLMAVIDSYVSIMSDDIAALRREAVANGGLDDTYFAWAGPTERGEVAYYRVQGQNFLIEFDNTQEDPNHIHAAFRDFDGDLGRDLLREHVARSHSPVPLVDLSGD